MYKRQGTLGAIQRAILRLDRLVPLAFGKPILDPFEAVEKPVTVIRAAPLVKARGVYGTFVAHILQQLYDGLGETKGLGMVVFIDESHLVFDGLPSDVRLQIETIVRLIRSKGVGLIFATQSPTDLPEAISEQLATRIQHGLRGSTPKQIAKIRAAAQSLPVTYGFNAFNRIKSLGIGEALVSVPNAKGVPTDAQQVKIFMRSDNARPLFDNELKPDIDPPRVVQAYTNQRNAEDVPSPPPKKFKLKYWHYIAALALLLYAPIFLGY